MVNKELQNWKERLAHNESKWESNTEAFNHREELVRKKNTVKKVFDEDQTTSTPHVQNICFELIESQVDTTIPSPKVTAKNKEDEDLAKIIEDMLRDEMDRLPMETINDMMERTVPIQGGAFLLFEWDNSLQTQNTIGDLTVQYLHPKQVVPQDGVFDSLDDMDYIFLKIPQTKEYIKRRYGIDVSAEGEEDPSVRGVGEDAAASDLVTQIVVFYKNDDGGIGKYSWVNDTELENIKDYQARRLRRCKKCGMIEPADTKPLDVPAEKGKHPDQFRNEELPDDFDGEVEPKKMTSGNGDACPYCGSKSWEDSNEEYEEIFMPKKSTLGVEIPGAQMKVAQDDMGNAVPINVPTKIPYYKPNIYPIVMQKSVSKFGQLLGDSDIDQIEDQQNTINRMWAKILPMVTHNGSFAVMPPGAHIRVDNEEMKVIREDNLSNMGLYKVFDMMPNAEVINSLFNLKQAAYEEARQVIGITDSFQGRRDETATSGKAKEFSAQQAAGRLESKRQMKEAAYQQIFEAIFKFKLAYADDPRPIVAHDENGQPVYEKFDRYDFLKQDVAGQWYWNDDFIFGVDASAPLARDREALWQETRMNFQQGAYGDPAQLTTLAFFWTRMDELHYPGAAATKKHVDEMIKQQQIMQMQQMQMQQQMMAQQAEAAAVQNILGGANDGNPQGKEASANQRNQTQG